MVEQCSDTSPPYKPHKRFHWNYRATCNNTHDAVTKKRKRTKKNQEKSNYKRKEKAIIKPLNHIIRGKEGIKEDHKAKKNNKVRFLKTKTSRPDLPIVANAVSIPR